MSIKCFKLDYAVKQNGQQKILLNSLDTIFEAAKVSVIIGNNGAGKSTLLKLLSKEFESTAIEFNGKNLFQWNYQALAQQRAVLPQQQPMLFPMTVYELVAMGAEVQSSAQPKQKQAIILEVLTLCDLTELTQRNVLSLSGGELQRAHLARVLVQIWPENFCLSTHESATDNSKHQPLAGKWLFLDEWSNGLDLHHQQLFICLFKQLAQAGLGMVMILHDLNLAAQLADEVKVLKQGELVLQGAPKEVLTSENLRQSLNLKATLYERQDEQFALLLNK